MLPTPEHFEQATELVTLEATRESVVAGNDPTEHLEQIQKYADAGYDELYLANMGPHYLDMIAFYGEEVLPRREVHVEFVARAINGGPCYITGARVVRST